ncbi:MAG: phosphatase PAP2 family protein [Pelobium sp.]
MKDFGKKHAVQILGLILTGFMLLTILVLFFPNSWLDSEFSEEIQEHHNNAIDFLMKGISWFGQMWVSISLVSISSILFLLSRKKKEAIFCMATLLIGLITYLIKIAINRPRPGADMVRVIVDVQHQSFPSGHVSFYIVFFGFIAFLLYHDQLLDKPLRYIVISSCIFLILTIPISRIYLGAHWFTDVFGGFLLGSVYLGLLLTFFLKDRN